MPAPTKAPLGRLAKIAFLFSNSGVWHTEQTVSGGNGHLVPFDSFAPGNTRPESYFPSGAGMKNRYGEVLNDIKAPLDGKLDMRYDGAAVALLAALFGADSSSVVDTSAYIHTLSWSDYLTAIGTVALWHGQTNGTVQVVPSAKLTSIIIEGKSSGALTLTVKGMGDEVILNSVANDASVLGGMSLGSDAKRRLIPYWHARTRGLFNSGFIRLKRVTGAEGNCSASDDIFPSAFKLTLDRKLKQHEDQDKTGTEPTEDGQPDMKIEFDIPGFEGNPADKNGVVYNAVQRLQSEADTEPDEYKADMYFESPTLAGAATAKYSWRSKMPALALAIRNPGVPGMGMTPVKLEGTLMEAPAARNGSDWAGITTPIEMKFTNQRATAYI